MSTIAPNNPAILYSPYAWQVIAGSATTIQAAAYIKMLVTGNPVDLTATFDLTGVVADLPELTITVDNLPPVRVMLAASIPLTMPSSNTWQKHTITIEVAGTSNANARWSGATAVRFTGITSTSTIALGTARRRGLTGLVIGDSINEGFRALASTGGTNPSRNDGRLGWGYPLGEILGCEIGVVGFAGTGISKNGDGSVPKFGSMWKLLRAGVNRSLANLPDFVVINAGTNDSAIADATVQADMTAWLNDIIVTLPSVPIIVLRPWNGAKATPIQAACTAATDPARVTYVDTTGWWNNSDASDGLHPYGYINTADLSPRIGAVVAGKLATEGPATPPTGAWIMTSAGLKPIPG